MDLTPPNVQSLDDVRVYLERVHEYLKWIGNFQCQFIEWQEVDAPERPLAGRARMYAVESDDGRTQLVAIFDTGDAIVMVMLTQRVPRNMVFIPFHFFDCVNRLTLGLLDPHSRQPAFKQAAVRIEHVDQEQAARLNKEARTF